MLITETKREQLKSHWRETGHKFCRMRLTLPGSYQTCEINPHAQTLQSYHISWKCYMSYALDAQVRFINMLQVISVYSNTLQHLKVTRNSIHYSCPRFWYPIYWMCIEYKDCVYNCWEINVWSLFYWPSNAARCYQKMAKLEGDETNANS